MNKKTTAALGWATGAATTGARRESTLDGYYSQNPQLRQDVMSPDGLLRRQIQDAKAAGDYLRRDLLLQQSKNYRGKTDARD